MIKLNTKYPTILFHDYIIDPKIMDNLLPESKEKHQVKFIDYKDEFNPYNLFLRDIGSNFLEFNNFKHNKNKWFIDIIRYNLNNDRDIDSGLAWHCENDNYPNVITLLLYLRFDKTIIDGNLRYKDINNKKITLKITSGTTIIMDGNVIHKPQKLSGSGIRDLIIISFQKK